jgi:dTDP-4-amino-4,6-dideoxygalactose transaminase
LITDFPMYRGLPSAQRDNLPAATQAAARVLCLPIYPALTDADVERVVGILAAHGA